MATGVPGAPLQVSGGPGNVCCCWQRCISVRKMVLDGQVGRSCAWLRGRGVPRCYIS